MYIVFDFDGTIYDISGVREMVFMLEINFLCEHEGMNEEQARKFLVTNNILTRDYSRSKSATECFLRNGINPEEWSAYRTKHFDVSCIDPEKSVTSETLSGFRKFGKVLLLSSNTREIISRIMRRINIWENIFDEIICSDSDGIVLPFSKRKAFGKIIRDYNINACDLLSIGDRYHTDIEPVIELGGNGILIKSPSSVQRILEDMNSCRV